MFSADIKEFVRTYLKDMENSSAAIFAGAGLSRPSGYVDWKELLADVADDLGLDINEESDLIALAQYHVNEFGGRHKINQILIDEFTRSVKKSENHKILSKLPIDTYWTTNYDQLIELSLEEAGKTVDKKITVESLANTIRDNDATVYKMHGDSSLPHEAVLTKDDYEGYDQKRELYSTALRGDLVSKTFLFIGFSFDDPNLSQVLSRIRILLNENQRTHYCFMKKINKDYYKGQEKKFQYESIKQELKIRDLKRYGIKVLLIDDYQEITTILKHLYIKIKRKNIFVSGSAVEYGSWKEAEAFNFSSQLSKSLIQNDYNIVSGFGLGIGSCIVSGALEELYSNQHKSIEKRLKSKPFPQSHSGSMSIKELWTNHRESMLTDVGIAIFIFGNKQDKETKEMIEANGMLEEFEIAIKKDVIPIPVGATGYMAETLWNRVMDDYEDIVGIDEVKSFFEDLNDREKDSDELISLVRKIVRKLV